jgi:type IV secretion system protein VirD4
MEAVVLFIVALIVLAAWAEAEAKKKRIKEAYTFDPEKAHGSARFANKQDLKKARLFKSGGIHIGFFDGRKLFVNSSSHLLLVAGARAGKLVTILAAAVLSLPRKYSLAIFDPKAEITCICAHYLKASGRDVYVLNPYGIWLDRMKGLKQATFNPMSSLDPQSSSFHADCDKLAEAICYEENHTGDSHWITSARLLISGIVAALAKYGVPADKNLVAVRNVITGANGQSVFDFCRECMALKDPFIRQKLARFAVTAEPPVPGQSAGKPGAEESRELNSVVSTADTQTGWIGNEAIAGSLKGGANEISFKDLKRKAGTVISVCLPLAEFSVSDKWFRVLCATMISDTLKEGLRGKGAKVVAVLDEVYQVGYLKVLADAWGMAAGAAALQLWAVYQDVSQIMAQFKTPGWQTMVQNSGAAMYFGIRDQQTAEFVSKQCGITEVLSQSKNVSIDPRSGEPIVNNSATQTARPLLHPDEVRFGLKPDEMLLFADGLPGVCRATRKKYFECLDLKGKHRDNPYFQKDGAAARFLRWLF